MIKKIFLVLIMSQFILANVLIFGDSKSKAKCDGTLVLPISIKDCNDFQAIDDINICYFKKNNLGCKKIFSGESISLNEIEKESISFDRLLSFNSNSSTSLGLKRFSSEESLKEFPSGFIIKPKKDIVIKLDKKYDIRFKLISSNNKVLSSIKKRTNLITIKSSKLVHSKKYKIEVYIDTLKYNSDFEVLDKNTEKQIKNDIKNAENGIKDEKSRNIIKSIVYDQYGLTFDRKMILEKGVF